MAVLPLPDDGESKSLMPSAGGPDREIRFAVVMYGGVSLGVYMNGVAEELLRLVRATGPNDAGEAASSPKPDEESTEDIYREIGRELDARFVIDILAGSSAGGVNALFLATALATGGDLGSAKNAWVREADVRLIFDPQSLEGTKRLRLPHPRPSLFNGDRMYQALLRALDQMDESRRKRLASVEQIDLFVTATDLEGLPLDVALSDMVVKEKRYRTVLHFRREPGSHKDDFVEKENPFLAFASRCTSSFPVAFEPPRLTDLRRMSPNLSGAALEARLGEWRRFLPECEAGEVPAEERVFADGGYLDNKPFESVLACIERRDGDLPAERVLLYVDPDPDHPESESGETEQRPDALTTALRAFTLARKETIRNEITRANQRKRFLERLGRILADVHKDTRSVPPHLRRSLPFAQWTATSMEEIVAARGPAYGGYHRAKVGAVTDELTASFATILDWDDDSDRRFALWLLVRAWRKRHFYCYRDERRPDQKWEGLFLSNYDASYRLRRLYLVVRVLDDILEVASPRWSR
jgi:patatin-related protein